MVGDCSKCKTLDEILNDKTLTAEKLLSHGASPLVRWDGHNRRDILSGEDSYILVVRGLCSHMEYHSIIFIKNGKGYYIPEI